MDHRAGLETAADIGGSVLVKLLVPGEERLPAYAERKIEARTDLELVLCVEELLRADRITARLAEDDAHRIERPEQEIGIGIARPCASEGRAAGLGQLIVQDPIHIVHLVAPFERV